MNPLVFDLRLQHRDVLVDRFIEVRRAVRQVIEERPTEMESVLAAVGKRETEIAAVDLGPYEALDEAIDF